MSTNQKGKGTLHGMAFMPLVAAFGSGATTAGNWLASAAAKVAGKTSLVPGAASGSILVGTIGGVGLAYFLTKKMIDKRGWLVVLLAWFLDTVLSALLQLKNLPSMLVNPLGFWPYVLGSLATFCVGTLVGALFPRTPLRYALAFVFVDFVIVGITAIWTSYTLAWDLITRVGAACLAAAVGALLGAHIANAVRADPSTAIRKSVIGFLGVIVTAVIGALVTVAIDYFKSLMG